MGNAVCLLLVAASLLAAPEAAATHYTLWIHGRNTSRDTLAGNYGDFKD
jgi:hypothetical protein